MPKHEWGAIMTNQEDDARTRAQKYAEGKGEPPAKPARTRSESEWRDAVGEAIENAMREGEFDSLPGKGKPLKLERDPFAPEGSEMAWGILKNNDLTPGWIGARNDLLREVEVWRARLHAIVERFAREATSASGAQREATIVRWSTQRQGIEEEMQKLNQRIRDLNLQQPVSHLEVFLLRLNEELRRAGLPEEMG